MGNQTSQVLQKDSDFNRFAKFIHFSPFEIKEWSNSFKTLYPSGKMSLKDMEEFYSKLFPFGKVHNFCKRLFKNINIGQNTQIELNDLLISFTILFKGSSFERLRWIFRFYDSDNDGFICKEDMNSGMSILNEMISNSIFSEIEIKKITDEIFDIVQNESGFLTLNDFEILSNKMIK